MKMKSTPVFEREVRPIFIIGAPRSGTSVMTWAIGQHPNIQPMPETGWIASMVVGAFASYRKGSERENFSHLSNVNFPLSPFMRRIGEAVDAIVHDVYEERNHIYYGNFRKTGKLVVRGKNAKKHLQLRRSVDDPKHRWIDGTPLNSFYIWALAQMFPEARFIHNLRVPDQVATSLEGFATVGADPLPLDEGIRSWISHTENAWWAERALGAERVFRTNFERIAAEPEALLRDICAFLGEQYAENCLIPLGERLNSSEVDDKQEKNVEILRQIESFQTAEALYQQILAKAPPVKPESEAMDVIRQRFFDYCHERDLV